MKKKFINCWLIICLLSIGISSCRKNRGEGNEEEILTTLTITFIPTGGGSALVYSYDDADGPGGANPIQDEIVLTANKNYNVSLTLMNKTTNPDTDITSEIISEPDAHRFYYEPSASSNIMVSNLDNDPDGIPLGISGTWTTTAPASGTMRITLRHYPGNPSNKATADPVNSSKSATDIEVTFVTKVQ